MRYVNSKRRDFNILHLTSTCLFIEKMITNGPIKKKNDSELEKRTSGETCICTLVETVVHYMSPNTPPPVHIAKAC